jgi:hypothetical protein
MDQIHLLTTAVKSLVKLAQRLNIDVSDLTAEINAVVSYNGHSPEGVSSKKRSSPVESVTLSHVSTPQSLERIVEKSTLHPEDDLSSHLSRPMNLANGSVAIPTSASEKETRDLLAAPAGSGPSSPLMLHSLHAQSPDSSPRSISLLRVVSESATKVHRGDQPEISFAEKIETLSSHPTTPVRSSSPMRLTPAAAPQLPPPFQSSASSRSLTTMSDVPLSADFASPLPIPSKRSSLAYGRSPSSGVRSRYATMQHDRTPPSLAAAMGAASSRPLVSRATSLNSLPPASSGSAVNSSVRAVTAVAKVSATANSHAIVPTAVVGRPTPMPPPHKDVPVVKSGPQRVAMTVGGTKPLQSHRSHLASHIAASHVGSEGVRRPGSGSGVGLAVSASIAAGSGGGVTGIGGLKQPPRRV